MEKLLALVVGLGFLHIVTSCNLRIPSTTERVVKGKFCYAFIASRKSYDDAMGQCLKFGGVLASIHSAETNKALVDLMKATHYQGKAWIGLTDQVEEGSYKWADGSKLDFTNWGKDEGPGQNYVKRTAEDCVALGSEDSHWRDMVCDGFLGILKRTKLTFFCEFLNKS